MVEKSEKERRRALKKEYKNKEREFIFSTLPVSPAALTGLFDHVKAHMQEYDCDETLRFSIEFAEQSNWDVDKITEWLRANGGYCDCEVLMNVEELVNDE
jgi:hypothetical protein